MADSEQLHLLIAELRDFYDVERHLTRALSRLPQGTPWSALRDAFETQLTETQGEISRLERLIEDLWEKVRSNRDDGSSVPTTAVRIAVRTSPSTLTTDVPHRREDYDEGDVDTLVAWARAICDEDFNDDRTGGPLETESDEDGRKST